MPHTKFGGEIGCWLPLENTTLKKSLRDLTLAAEAVAKLACKPGLYRHRMLVQNGG